ncbi:MAG: tetratricopeptide repeat protein, partial [Bacteroidota bacterium]
MYKRLAYVVGIGLAVLAAVDAQAQSGADAKKHDRAQELESQGSHNEAVVLYRELLESQPENVTFHYELGLIFTQKLGNGSDAIPLWEKVAADDSPRNRSDGQFYLGRSYQLINRFDEAIGAYRKFGDLAREESSYNPHLNDYNRLIAQCDFAKGSTPDKGVVIMNLGEGVNTNYPEYIPVVDRADSVLLYTSRRKTNTGGKIDRDDQQYYEDMYVSYSDQGNYGTGTLYDGSKEFLGIILN